MGCAPSSGRYAGTGPAVATATVTTTNVYDIPKSQGVGPCTTLAVAASPVDQLCAMKLSELKGLMKDHSIPMSTFVEKREVAEAIVSQLGEEKVVDLLGLGASDPLSKLREAIRLVGALASAAARLREVFSEEVAELERKRGMANGGAVAVYRGAHQGRGPSRGVAEEVLQVAQDRCVAVGTVVSDADHEHQRLERLAQEVEVGSMRAEDVRLPDLVRPVLQQVQACMTGVRALRSHAGPRQTGCPALPAPPSPRTFREQMLAIKQLESDIAVEEKEARDRILAISNG
mmetsp:Transcript_52871/g.113326  ORF Transcript_52871/g.113326 Transcript_52871/m.113326 type:complete len:288 (+) Transcript_52871:17-880(+)